MVNRTRLILSGIGLFIVLIILAVGVLTIGRQVTFQNRASSDAGTATFSITPNTGTVSVGNTMPINLQFDTVGASNGISIAQFAFSLPSGIDLVDSAGTAITQLPLDSAFTASGTKWSTQTNAIARSEGTVTVQISVTYNDTIGFSATTPVVLSSVYLKGITAGTYPITFNTNDSMILTKSFPTQDIMKTPVTTSFTVNASQPGVGHLIFSPASGTFNTGTVNKVDVSFNTGGVAVSSLSFRLTYPYTGTTPALDVVDSTGAQTAAIIPDAALLSSADWTFPVKSVTRSGSVVTIDFAALNSNVAGFAPTADTKVVTFYLRAGSVPTTNPVVMSFVAAQTSMLSKAANPSEILQQPTSLSYTINAATDTTAPNVTLTAPAAGNVSGTVTMSATATDNVGVSKVDFYAGTTLVGTDTTSPYSVTWNTTTIANGTYTLTARATDAANNVGTSANVNVTVNNVSTPSISFGFKVQGVSSALTKTFAITLGTSKNHPVATYSAALTSDATGVFRTSTAITLTGITVGTNGAAYEVSVKGPNTLNQYLGTITLVPGTNTAPTAWENVTASLGDFDTTLGTVGYNVMNISDIAKMIQNYTALSTTVTTANGLALYDVDNNGAYALRDIATVLGNYISLSVSGY